MTDINVKYQCEDGRCVPYALQNLLSMNKKSKDKLINSAGTLLSLSELCGPVRSLFGKSLMPLGKDLSWLLEQTSGLFLVVDGLHCVYLHCNCKCVSRTRTHANIEESHRGVT